MLKSCSLAAAALLASTHLGDARMLIGQEAIALESVGKVQGTPGKDSFCSNPAVKEKVQFPDSLAGRAQINYEMYSGYINVTSEDYLFYWFFGTADGNEDAPLVIWTNGGPGCTAMVMLIVIH